MEVQINCLQLNQVNTIHDKEIINLSLINKITKVEMYNCDVIDNIEMKDGVVVYVIQQGKESEWFFSTRKGKFEVSEELGYKRTILVSIDYHRRVNDIEEIYQEVKEIGNILKYKGYKGDIQVMTDETGIGKRELLFEGKSKINGKLWVEETWKEEGEGKYSRKLIFEGERSLVQSEGISINKKIDIVESIKEVPYFKGIVYGIFNEVGENIKDITIIGGGVHILASGIKHWCKNAHVVSVEIDEVVNEAGIKCFNTGEEIERCVCDGVEYIDKIKTDYIIIDVDCKVRNENDIAAPHPKFIEESMIEKMKLRIKDVNGGIIYNIVARNDEQRNNLINKIKIHFNKVYLWENDEDVNVILFCFLSNSNRLNSFNNTILDFYNSITQIK
ncbi:hypothetical protein ENU1_052040 [Entamoeba nuttalli P19]|uniref:Spermine/spermidine synthase family protein n=1 Tax=Entamoeba nuttalli (strain P19) TaxID=1076696 RepID=K2GFR6_ENTNP|nr:hypothetical protein ENU1_052040 [Entamoeba nuttalli P19]EKE41551.1 hypothetical protein ENU1_052040 [Entamoeba nuttalli P19]|eukprot:XP_008856115.1 hypothetical protein ENU1_052040 [Entamoeba nuttalli P19]